MCVLYIVWVAVLWCLTVKVKGNGNGRVWSGEPTSVVLGGVCEVGVCCVLFHSVIMVLVLVFEKKSGFCMRAGCF